MTGKRRREHPPVSSAGDATVNPSTSHKLATLNPNWAQLQAKLNIRHRRHTSLESDTKKALQIQSSKASAENPEASSSTLRSIQPVNYDFSLTDTIAMDCEMVGVGVDGRTDALARVTLVNAWGNAIYDKYVRPLEVVTDFRSNISGVRAHDLRKAEDLWSVQKKVSELIKGRILVGHALHNDLKVEDARAAMFIYQKLKKEWERSIREKRKKRRLQAN